MRSPSALTAARWPAPDSDHLLVTGAQMAALEQQLFASGLPVEALMEKAALAVATAIQNDWGERLERHGALVLVGPGHNGGDGLVIARELHLAGIAVAIWSPFERHKPLTAAHLRHGLWLGLPQLGQAPDPASPALWIDALFGIGQSRPLSDELTQVLGQRQQQQPGALVAVDVPSGLDDSTGERLGEGCAMAASTYSIGLLKQGLIQDSALEAVGRLQRIELGLPAPLLQSLPANTPLALGADDGATIPWPELAPAAGKYERGRLLLVAGSNRYRGAAHLALQGASAAGCGSLRAALPLALADSLWQHCPHAVVQRALPCASSGALLLGELQASDLDRLDALVLGPGIGLLSPGELSACEAEREAASWDLLLAFPGLLLLDADGLNRSSAHWLRQRHGPTWITPHRGELARLWPQLAERPAVDAAAAAAADCGATVLLKGARSVIAAADGQRWQLRQANPAAARAGLGDVLAGFSGARGAQALACGQPCQSWWLAACGLEHATAALELSSCSPGAVAAALGRRRRTTC